MIKLVSGKPKVEYYPKTASTALALGSVVKLTSGQLVNGKTTENVGIVQRAVVAADADYASTTMLPVIIPDVDSIFEMDVVTGTIATTDVGAKFDIDATYLGVDQTATTYKACLLVGFISSTKGLFKLIGANWNDLS